MEFIEPKVAFSDIRGKLIEVIKGKIWKQMNHSFTKKDGVRGNHYHKYLKELFYILRGEAKINLHNINTGIENSYVLKSGQCFLVEPYELHTLTAITDLEMISLYSDVFDEKNPDLFRLDGKQQL